MNWVKKAMRSLHLWLGLASGIVVLVVSLTGAALTFEEEIERHLISPERWLVRPEARLPLPLDSLMRLASPALLQLPHGHPASRAFVYTAPDRSVVVGFNYQDWTGENRRGHAFLNPYTGQLLGTQPGNPHHPFWQSLTELHINLWLGEVGSALVTWGTLIFLVLVLSGIVLWWPKNRSAAKQRVWFRWKKSTRWKRKNYDLHNILGFYACWVVFFMITTGAMWAFDWFNRGVYFLTSGGQALPVAAESGQPAPGSGLSARYPIAPTQYRLALKAFRERYPAIYESATEISVGYFADEKEPLLDISASFDPQGIRGQKAMAAYFDKTTNRLVKDNLADTRNFGDAVQLSTNELHYGTFFGLASKVLTFLACLVTATLPVSGFYVWYGRRKRPARPVRQSDRPRRFPTKPIYAKS